MFFQYLILLLFFILHCILLQLLLFHFIYFILPLFILFKLIALLEKIADLVNDKKLEGISDLRDESDRDGIRVVVELKRDAVPALVQNNLFKKTSLQWAFSGM